MLDPSKNYAGKYTAGWSAIEQVVVKQRIGPISERRPSETNKDGMATLTRWIEPTMAVRDVVQAVHGTDEGRDDPSLCVAQHLSPFLWSPSQSSSTKLVFHSLLLMMLLSNSYPSELQRVKASRIDIDVRGGRKTESLGWSSWLTKISNSDQTELFP